MPRSRHASPTSHAPGARTRPAPTTRGHLARLVGLGAAFIALVLGGFPGAILLALHITTP